MKKLIIAAVVLAALAGVSTGVFMGFRAKSQKEAQKQEEELADNVLFDISESSIIRVEIEYPDGSYTADLSVDSGEWILTDSPDGDSFSLNQSTLDGICTYINSLTANTSYGEATEENKAKYGLDEPYKVTVTDYSNSYTLYIGDKSPTGDYYYAYTDTKNNIYAISASDAENIITTRLTLRDNKLIPYTDNEVTGISVKRNGELIYELNYNLDSRLWELPDEYSMLTVNQTRPSSVVTNVTRMTAEEMFEISDDDFTKYGFDNPDAEFTIKGSDGTEKTILVSKYGKNAQTYLYVYLTDTKQVETYYTADLKFIEYNIFDLILQTIEIANMYAVSSFEIECAELSESFSVDAANSYAECRGQEIDLSSAEIKSFFETFYNIFSYIGLTDIDVNAEPELSDPVFSAKYTKTDGSISTIDLVSTGEGSRCYVFSNGEYTGTITESSFISGANSMISAYEILCTHAGIEPDN